MDLSFGTRLRMHRERQQVALTAIAEQTKIRVSLLEGLERDDLSYWPGGIFRRSYVRDYAQAIGLAPDIVVREFLELYPDPDSAEEIPGALAPAQDADGERPKQRPPTRLGLLLGSAIGSLPGRRPDREQRQESAIRNASIEHTRLDIELDASPLAQADVAPRIGGRSIECVPFTARHDISAVARLCTRLGRAAEPDEVASALEEAAGILDAVGLILWMWQPEARILRPVFACGYSGHALTQMTGVRRDADNAIADAFRSADTCVVDGHVLATGALVVPLLTPTGCVGVLALELRHRGEQREDVRAFVTILAAQLSTLVGVPELSEALSA